MIGLRHFYGDLPMRGIWFAPYGTPCPRNAWDPLGPEWKQDLPRDEPERLHGFGWDDPYRIMPPDRYTRMSMVFDAGTATERARLLLPQLQVLQSYDGPMPGVVAQWMVTAPRRRRWTREREQLMSRETPVTPYGRGGGGGAAATANPVPSPTPRAALAEAACAARSAGMGTGDIIDHVAEALTRHGQEEKRAKTRTAFHQYLTTEVGELLRAGLIDELAIGLAEVAQRLADEGVLLVRER